MDTHSVVDDWDAVPFDGGFDGIDTLASRGFSGAIEAGGTWLFLSDGEALAVVSDPDTDPQPGDIGVFENATGRRYEAPTSGVATLVAMFALDGDVRGRYFTDDTSLDTVDETLSGGGFTGYVELSENVLSGDYYYVYIDGEVEHVGFVGTSQFLSGEEAKSKATGEVGIYDVVAVKLPRPELPEPTREDTPVTGDDDGTESSDGAEPVGGGATDAVQSDPVGTQGSDETAESDPSDTEPPAPTDAAAEDESGGDDEPGRNDEPAEEPTTAVGAKSKATEAVVDGEDDDEATETEALEADSEAEGTTAGAAPRGGHDDSSPAEPTGDEPPAGEGGRRHRGGRPETGSKPADTADDTPAELSEGTDGDPTSGAAADGRANKAGSATNDATSGKSTGIKAVTNRTVPSLDPENSRRVRTEARSPSNDEAATGPQSSTTHDTGAETAQQRPERSTPEADRSEAIREKYESKIERYEARIESLESELDDSDSRIESLEAKIESVRAERDDLQERLDSAGGTDTLQTDSRSPAEALAGTRLFIRENSRGEGTLTDVHDGADRETVISNLRVEYHTEFDDDAVSVDGELFEPWLRSSEIYGFAEWLVFELLFEIRSTNAVEGLRPLYDALPGIDRIGFVESVTIGDGTDGREVEFDLVARDKKGNPLVVVTFDEGRNPTRAEVIEPLVTDASDVCTDHETLAGAVAITSSYFESDAMAAAEEATGTSLLSRSKHRSYVKLSRTNGYHLCLVEARDDSFNLTVPEL